MAQVTGGRNLGRASGEIVIDTSQLRSAAGVVRAAGQQMRQSMDQVAGGARQVQGAFQAALPVIRQLGAALGIAFGAATVRQFGAFALSADQLATSFRRQSVAAVSLAGSQARLNQLLVAYDRVTGGAVNRSAALADVTSLLAQGFARTTEDLERFVTVARGISIATGRSQENVTQILQLALANQSLLRLNELGLGVEEVQQRMEELRATNASLSREMAFQIAVMGLAEEKYGALANSSAAQATGAERAARAWEDFRLAFGQATGPGISNLLSNTAETLNSTTREAQALADSPLIQFFQHLTGEIGLSRTELDLFLRQLERSGGLFGLGIGIVRATAIPPATTPAPPIGAPSLGPSGLGLAGQAPFSEDAIRASLERMRSLEQIERAAADQRLDATEQYERQRTETIRSYEINIARDAEDFARNRARAIAAFERSLASVREDAVRREELAERDFGERLADIRGDAQRRLAELDERFQRDRLRRERDARDRIADAAARLNAAAVFEAQRNAARARQDAEENLREQRADIREQLAEREQQERRSHERRLADAREAERRRIADMVAAFEIQRAEEDEDRQIRLARQAEDHQRQLAQQDEAHSLRIAQIARHAARERQELDRAFEEQLAELGLFNDAYIQLEKARHARALAALQEFIDQVNARFAVQGPQLGPDPFLTPRFQGEFPPFIGGATASGSGGRSITVASGAIVVNAAPGQSEVEIARIVDQRLTALLNYLANQ